jgi:hypothetical protein
MSDVHCAICLGADRPRGIDRRALPILRATGVRATDR